MELRRFDAASLARVRQALVDGEPVHLVVQGSLPPGLRIDELAPLLSSVRTHNRRLKAAIEARMAPTAALGDCPEITVVIPTHRRQPLGLRALATQDVRPRILVLSNGDDGPLDAPGADVIRVPWLGHGRTRQDALRFVDTPLVFFTVDDAIPLGRGFLRALAMALEEGALEAPGPDGQPWDAMVARQLPWPDANHVTAERLRRWTPSGSRIVQRAQADNVGTLYRTDVLRAHPFPDVPIAEDAWWSRGRRVGYLPMAPLIHAHPRSPRALLRRERAMHEQLAAMGEPPAIPTMSALVGALPGVLRPALKGGGRELSAQVAELVGQYLGARRARRKR